MGGSSLFYILLTFPGALVVGFFLRIWHNRSFRKILEYKVKSHHSNQVCSWELGAENMWTEMKNDSTVEPLLYDHHQNHIGVVV